MLGLVDDGVRAGYLGTDAAAAHRAQVIGVDLDLWQADLEGLAIELDPSARNSVRVREDVAPERLRLLVESESDRMANALMKSLGCY
ncbi:MAG TPA: hypothetical protein VGH82_06045 [Gaiellaceae bacterium]|jgi:hypothetical protein